MFLYYQLRDVTSSGGRLGSFISVSHTTDCTAELVTSQTHALMYCSCIQVWTKRIYSIVTVVILYIVLRDLEQYILRLIVQ